MKPRITIDRFARGRGWICRHFVTNTIGSGDTPEQAFAAWQAHVAQVCRPAFPKIDPFLLPEKESQCS